jgi:hypothetical protein
VGNERWPNKNCDPVEEEDIFIDVMIGYNGAVRSYVKHSSKR